MASRDERDMYYGKIGRCACRPDGYILEDRGCFEPNGHGPDGLYCIGHAKWFDDPYWAAYQGWKATDSGYVKITPLDCFVTDEQLSKYLNNPKNEIYVP